MDDYSLSLSERASILINYMADPIRDFHLIEHYPDGINHEWIESFETKAQAENEAIKLHGVLSRTFSIYKTNELIDHRTIMEAMKAFPHNALEIGMEQILPLVTPPKPPIDKLNLDERTMSEILASANGKKHFHVIGYGIDGDPKGEYDYTADDDGDEMGGFSSSSEAEAIRVADDRNSNEFIRPTVGGISFVYTTKELFPAMDLTEKKKKQHSPSMG